MAIDSDMIGRALAERGWRLDFSRDLEARFEAETGDARCRLVIRHNFVGIAIYNAFLLGDWYLVNDIFAASVCLHLLVMTPIMGFVIGTLAKRPRPWLREGILAGGIVLGTAAILGLMLFSRSPLRTSEHISVVLVILFATMVQRIRFPYVATAGLVSLALYAGALATLAGHDPARAAVAIAVFTGVVLFSLIGCYNLEREQRTGYLLSLRDRLRNEELEAVSRQDPLTGLGNRRALDRAIARRQAARETGGASPVATLIFDIDFFKTYNDDNGHLAGDDCIRRVAGKIADDRGHDRDRVFRYGGEEFLILIDDCGLEDALPIAERLRAAVEGAAIPRGVRNSGVITVSVGVDVTDDEHSIVAAIARADRALYGAKASGRNCVRTLARRQEELAIADAA